MFAFCTSCSPKANSFHDESRHNIAEDHWCAHDAQYTADETAQDAVDFSEEVGTDELAQHSERIQAELNAASGWWQEWLSVRIIASFSYFALISNFFRHDSEI